MKLTEEWSIWTKRVQGKRKVINVTICFAYFCFCSYEKQRYTRLHSLTQKNLKQLKSMVEDEHKMKEEGQNQYFVCLLPQYGYGAGFSEATQCLATSIALSLIHI